MATKTAENRAKKPSAQLIGPQMDPKIGVIFDLGLLNHFEKYARNRLGESGQVVSIK